MKNRLARVALWVQPQHILLAVDGRTGEQILTVAAETTARDNGLVAARVFDALRRRELAGSTALSDGFAIPHARIAGIARPLTVYLRTREPIDFGASDGRPVTDFLVILVPADGANDDHLQLLAVVARLLSDRRFRAQIRGASSAIVATNAFTTGIERVLVP